MPRVLLAWPNDEVLVIYPGEYGSMASTEATDAKAPIYSRPFCFNTVGMA